MNIGPLIRNLVGDTKAGTPRTMELKTGQVVRGTVLSVSEDGQEAVIQVQGVKLHATLETPLKSGETTLLQVQQPNQDGTVVLKPMGTLQGVQLSEASMTEVLKTLGLENTPANRELISQMQANGLPLTKESLAQIVQTLAHKPVEVPLSEWIQAAGIANGRGLPITGESVAGLHQAIFGPPLHELLSTLEEGLAQFFGQKIASTGKGVSGEGPGFSGNATTVANSGQLISHQNNSGTQASANSQTVVNSKADLSNTVQTGNAQNGLLLQGLGGEKSGASLLLKLQNVLADLRSAIPQEVITTTGANPQGAEIAKPAAHSQAATTTSVPAGNSPAGSGQAAAASAAAAMAAPAVQGEEGQLAPSPGTTTRPTVEAEPWVGRVLKLLGAEHEQQSLRAAAPSAPAPSSAPQTAGAAQQALAGRADAPGDGAAPPATAGGANAPAAATGMAEQGASAAAVLHSGGGADKAVATVAALNSALHAQAADAIANASTAKETLKGLLLQIAAADDVPAPLQEAAKQLVHQLTGQQLLLNTDRTSPFAQVTLFIPFIGPDGQQTASVHIESRRGRKGEMDPANCRLWFDLQMKALGQIMVDVQVADKKVLLKIYSEHESTGVFLESRQEDIEAALEATGYRLLSMKAEPLIRPESEDHSKNELGMSATYTPSPYKGVDYRI